MNDDKELKILKQKKIKELMKRIENQNKQDDPKEILLSRLVDRGDEVLKIAETYYPKEIYCFQKSYFPPIHLCLLHHYLLLNFAAYHKHMLFFHLNLKMQNSIMVKKIVRSNPKIKEINLSLQNNIKMER